jgi:hypothetical protein
MVVRPGDQDAALVLSAASRPLRRQLRALTWVTLEEVALEAVAEDGRLVARTSARQVADRLRVDPAAAAGALRALRDRGFLALERDRGEARRFGLSAYVLGPVAGLNVVVPCATDPHVVLPRLATPSMDGDDRFGPPALGKSPVCQSPSLPSLQCPGQETPDLEAGS